MRVIKMDLKGKVIWFYGLSGSGKTTLADMLAEEVSNKKCYAETDDKYKYSYSCHTQRLDGDIVREELTKDLGFSLEDRFKHIRRVAFVADVLSKLGVTVIASFITPLTAMRIYLREKFGDRLILIYASCSLSECIKRDTKGLYKKALEGDIEQMTGLTQKFDYPLYPNESYFNIVVDTQHSTKEECLKTIMELLNFA